MNARESLGRLRSLHVPAATTSDAAPVLGISIEAASLTAPDRVEAIASSEIGMKTPRDTQIILVKRVNKGGKAVPDAARKAEGPTSGPGRS